MKVLVIDDSEISLEATAIMLKEAGFDVVTLRGPFGSAAAINSNHPDVILIDVGMPGLAGDKLVTLLRQHTKSPLLLYSEKDEEELAVLAKNAGADGYVPKSAPPLRVAAALRAAAAPKVG